MKIVPYDPSAPDGAGNPMFTPPTGLEGAEGVVTRVVLVFTALLLLALLARLLLFASREERTRTMERLFGLSDRLLGTWRFVFLYCAMARWILSPVLLAPASRVIGSPFSDVWKHLWGHWWVRDSLLKGGGLPLHTTLVGSPVGGSLYCIDPLDALVSVPLQGMLGPIAAFNVQLFLHLVLGATAAFFLARHLCGSRPASFIAGTIYAFSPYMLSYPLSSGVTETANIEWLPLYALFLVKTVSEGGWRSPVLAAIFLFLTAFSCWYYGALAVIFTALYLLYTAAASLVTALRTKASRLSLKAAMQELCVRATAPALRLVVMAALFGAMILLPALAFVMTIESDDSLLPRYVTQRSDADLARYLGPEFSNYACLADIARPGKGNLNVTLTGDMLLRSSYLGFLVLFLAALGLTKSDRNRGWWLLCTASFLLLAMGPYLMVSQSIHLAAPSSPVYRLFTSFVPFFTKMAIPFRFALAVALSLAMLAALGYRRLASPHPQGRQAFFAILLAGQILAEFFLLAPAGYPALSAQVKVPALYADLAKEAGDCTVLDLPSTRGFGRLNITEYFLYQSVHRKGIPYHISGSFDRNLQGNAFTRAMFDVERGMALTEWELGRMKEGVKALARKKEIRYVLLHTHFCEPETRNRMEKLLVRFLGRPEVFRQGEMRILVFRLY